MWAERLAALLAASLLLGGLSLLLVVAHEGRDR